MPSSLSWDEVKRQANLRKHGLDFADAGDVLESSYRWDLEMMRSGENRVQSFSYVMGQLRVLTVVHTSGEGTARIISYRPASEHESEAYYEWIGQEDD